MREGKKQKKQNKYSLKKTLFLCVAVFCGNDEGEVSNRRTAAM
jgi:hypothetical protein